MKIVMGLISFFFNVFSQPYVFIPAILLGIVLTIKGMAAITFIAVMVALYNFFRRAYHPDVALGHSFIALSCVAFVLLSWMVYFLTQLNLSDLFSVLYGAGHSVYDSLLQQWRNGGWLR